MQNLLFDFLNVTELAAISVHSLIGCGDKLEIDRVATNAMRDRLNEISFHGHIALSEGKKDNAPMLENMENVGQGGDKWFLSVDAVEGTTEAARNGPNAVSVIAVAEQFPSITEQPVFENFYMNKLVVDKEISSKVHVKISDPIETTINTIKFVLNKEVLKICVLNRPRHVELIQRLKNCDCEVILFDNCDVVFGVLVGLNKYDLMLGVGGVPEGLISSAISKCLGGDFQGQIVDNRTFEPISQVYNQDDLVKGQVIVSATGVTDGELLNGVKNKDGQFITNSILLNSYDKSVRYVKYYYPFR